MPWKGMSVMEQREEFVRLALMMGANRRELCRRFGISRETGYKWLRRHQAEGRAGLRDRSRRPHASPCQSSAAIEAAVLAVRARSNNSWGGRKIKRVLERGGRRDVPSASTITAILRRHDKLAEQASEHPGPYQRFERAAPNELWQMDFKGWFAIERGHCHPLTVLDDHSRYNVGLAACGNEQDLTVRARLTHVFQHYGLPWAMLMDNGSPWGDSGDQPHTAFTVWLMGYDVRVIHGRPRHPQTQGKDERFHRTLKAEVLRDHRFRDLADCQRAFDAWRHVYNHERPHDALALATPAERYRASSRSFPARPPAIEYGPNDVVRKVCQDGFISFKGQPWRIGKAFRGQPLALRPTRADGVFSVHFRNHAIVIIDLRADRVAPVDLMDIARAIPTTPQAPVQRQVENFDCRATP